MFLPHPPSPDHFHRPQRPWRREWIVLLSLCSLGLGTPVDAAPSYRVLGQPTLADKTLASRCTAANARFNFKNDGGFEMHGPAGIAVDPRGRIFVTDFGGQRVLTWPNIDALQSCKAADGVLGAGTLAGPEAVAIDASTETVFVADSLSHTVKGYRLVGKSWTQVVRLGTPNVPGNGLNQFNSPRGLAVDSNGRLFVADDFNNRVLIFNGPIANGESAVDSIGAFANGGFNGPKGLAMVGHTLFVTDYNKNRVLRFTGPFTTPSQVYAATAVFTGLKQPVDLGVHPDGSLLVTDQGNQRIARYQDAVWAGSTGTPASTFAANMGPEPLGVAADRSGRVYIADYRAYRVLIRNEQIKTTPISKVSSAAAKALLANLHTRPKRVNDRVAIGQQLITWKFGSKTDPDGWYGDWLQMEQGGYPLPKIMGGELSELMKPNQNALDELIRHGQAGHIVTLVWHPNHPLGGQFGTPISTASLKNMVQDGTAEGRNWQAQLDKAATYLTQFKNANVPVLFRPLHEQNGNFFWWGHNGATQAALRDRQAAWVAMWRDMVTELTVRKGLNNLLFVYGTNQVNYNEVAPPLTYYPGAAWADAVGIDVYDEELDLAGSQRGLQHYAALVGTGKPFGLAEFGQSFNNNGTGANGAAWDARTLANRIRDSYPRTAFATAWYSSVQGGKSYVFALPDVSFGRELLQDSLIDTQ
ncbi:MAG: glycosyl hydrolase [Thermosynechococcaceae cyanobacterium]